MTPTPHQARRLTPLRVMLAVGLVVSALAFGSHEVALHSAACFFGPWRVPQCRVLP